MVMNESDSYLPPEANELFEHHRIVTDPGQAPLRVDKFLFSRLENISRNRIQNAAAANCILVNNKPVKPSYKVKPCDVVSVVLPYPPNEYELIPEEIELNIVYEDNDLIVINKPAGMVVHPAKGNYSGTLVNGLLWHFRDMPFFPEGKIRPGLVHRIDKDTSGLLVVAKNEIAHTHLARQFFDKTTQRTYIALVWGAFSKPEGTITGNIGRSVRNRKKMAVYAEDEQGKHAVTHYKVLEDFRYVSLIECYLETGRTHQIRAHFEFIKHPVFGDPVYGGDKLIYGNPAKNYNAFIENCLKICPRQALHAKSLGFFHYSLKKGLFFTSEMPEDIKNLVEKWRNYSVSR